MKHLKQSLNNLFQNQDFVNVIVNEYMENRAKELVLNEDLNNEVVIQKLKSIQDLKQFFDEIVNSDIIDNDET